jgi:hypothetical protein
LEPSKFPSTAWSGLVASLMVEEKVAVPFWSWTGDPIATGVATIASERANRVEGARSTPNKRIEIRENVRFMASFFASFQDSVKNETPLSGGSGEAIALG